MRRVQHATAKIDGNGAGRNGFSEGDVGTQAPATRIAAEWLNDVQEEIVNAIETAGLTPSSSRTQLADAIAIAATGSSSANAVSIRGTPVNASPAPATGDVIQHNGSAYVPGKVANANIAAAAAIAVSKLAAGVAGQVLGIVGGAAAWVSDTATSIRGTFVSTTAPTTADVLAHNGSQYAPIKIANAHVASNAAVAVSKLAAGSLGQFLFTSSTGPAWGERSGFVNLPNTTNHNVVVAGIDNLDFILFQPPGAPASISGMVPPAGSSRLRFVFSWNYTITLKQNDANSASGNRFTSTGPSGDIAIPPQQFAVLVYSSPLWYVLGPFG